MTKPLIFKNREVFRKWLSENHQLDEGVWLLFSKSAALETLKSSEALEEALCFGWIDGLMKRIDEKSYQKYFSPRRKHSKWSEKNKRLAIDLEKEGLMTDYGRYKIKEAKQNGQWDAAVKPSDSSQQQIQFVSDLLKDYDAAYSNFNNMPPSVKKTYTRAYFDAKTKQGRSKRLTWMINRLEKNLKPM